MELLSRVKALLRRSSRETAAFFSCGGIELDHTRRTAYADGQAMELTFKEYELLRYLMINPDRPDELSDFEDDDEFDRIMEERARKIDNGHASTP